MLLSLSRRKYCLIHLEIVKIFKNKIIMLKSYFKQENLFELEFNVKFPLLRLTISN